MVLGFSGSSGGVGKETFGKVGLVNRPLEVSYFVNNRCNLSCRHCYVGYEQTDGELSVGEWSETFDRLIERGALTFGNVGKEPLLSSDKTIAIMQHLAKRREEIPALRFGFVTNGTLLNGSVVKDLEAVAPDYIDVSLDGSERVHDSIRGSCNYERTVENLRGLPSGLSEKVFLSFTLMKPNVGEFRRIVGDMSALGLTKFLVSPYVATPGSNGELFISDEEVVDFYERVADGSEIKFADLPQIEIILKSDYDSQKALMDRLVERGVIDLGNLSIDEYGVIFNRHVQGGGSEVVVNYMPFSDTLSRAVRISHDGYVGGCLEMFHKDYPERARANLRDKKIEEILGRN